MGRTQRRPESAVAHRSASSRRGNGGEPRGRVSMGSACSPGRGHPEVTARRRIPGRYRCSHVAVRGFHTEVCRLRSFRDRRASTTRDTESMRSSSTCRASRRGRSRDHDVRRALQGAPAPPGRPAARTVRRGRGFRTRRWWPARARLCSGRAGRPSHRDGAPRGGTADRPPSRRRSPEVPESGPRR